MSEIYLGKFRQKMVDLEAEITNPVPDFRYRAMLRDTLKLYLEEPPVGISDAELEKAKGLVKR